MVAIIHHVFNRDCKMNALEKAKSYLGKELTLVIDHPIGTFHPTLGFEYKANYGFVPGSESADKHEIDAYFLGVDKPLDTADGVCIAIVKHDKDEDHKLVVVPKDKDLTDEEIESAIEFQEKEVEGGFKILR